MNKKVIGVVLTVVAVVVGVIVYSTFNPANNPIFPKCPFLVLTGFKCPGCGSQRAIHCLLHLDIIGAVKFNFMLVVSLPIIFVLLVAHFLRKTKPDFYAKVNNYKFTLVYFSIVVIWWVVRNIWDW